MAKKSSNYIVKIISSFIFAFLIGGISVVFLQNLAMKNKIFENQNESLTVINHDFPAEANTAVRTKFKLIDFLADSSYPAVAFQFNMGFQFSKVVQQFSDNKSLAVVLIDNAGIQKAVVGIDSDSAKHLVDVIVQNDLLLNKSVFHVGDKTIYVKKTNIGDLDSLGFLIGVLPTNYVERLVISSYFQRTVDLVALRPTVDFVIFKNKAIRNDEWNIAFKRKVPTVDLGFLQSNEFLIGIFALVVMMVLFSYWLRGQLQKPFDQISNIVNSLGEDKVDDLAAMLPTDQKFRDFALSLIQLRENQIKFEELSKETIKYQAISKTTQMLAHDVRKPFTMVKGLLDILEATEDPEKSKSIVQKFAPEVKGAILAVNGMIAYIMEVGSYTKPFTKFTLLESLFEIALVDTFRYDKESDIKISFEFRHRYTVDVDSLKVVRVISNIIGNAAEAMNKVGDIWIKSKDVSTDDGQFVEICIGNSGSYIEQSDIVNLFEAFFTKNKGGGTGLGLAISKKIVTSHGGIIRCESSKALGVEFFFTLPAGDIAQSQISIILPSSSRDISAESDFPNLKKSQVNVDEDILADKIQSLVTGLENPIRILVVDDEPIYQNLVEELLSSLLQSTENIELVFLNDSKGALAHSPSINPSVILMDIDMACQMTGFEVTKRLRESGLTSKICIHSNRGAFEYQSEAIKSGADLFLPKPISKAQLLRLILSALESNGDDRHSQPKLNNAERISKHAIILDDSVLLLEAWKSVTELKQERFLCPEDFYKALKTDPNILSNAFCIITDYHFDEVHSAFTGIDFAEKLKEGGVEIPIYLSSDGEFAKDQLGAITKKISKTPKEAWKEISESMNST